MAVANSFVVTDVGAAEMSRELIEAVRTDDLNQVERLIMSGVEVSGTRGDGSTALHWAVHRENIEISDLLIDSGADINAADDHGVTPLALAAVTLTVNWAPVVAVAPVTTIDFTPFWPIVNAVALLIVSVVAPSVTSVNPAVSLAVMVEVGEVISTAFACLTGIEYAAIIAVADTLPSNT